MGRIVKIIAIIVLVVSPLLVAFIISSFKGQTVQLFNLPARQSTTKPAPSSAAQATIDCPVSKEFCQQGKVIDNGDSFYGIAFTLPAGSPLLAVFSGQLSDQPKTPDRPATQPLLYLRDTQGLEAAYSYFGTANTIQSKNYASGEQLGKISKGQFPTMVPFSGSNLLFSVKKDGKFIKFALKQ